MVIKGIIISRTEDGLCFGDRYWFEIKIKYGLSLDESMNATIVR